MEYDRFEAAINIQYGPASVAVGEERVGISDLCSDTDC